MLASELGERPGASAIGFGSLWVAHPDRGVVARLDLADGTLSDSIPVGNAPAGIAIDQAGSVWVTNAGDGSIDRINVDTGEVTRRSPPARPRPGSPSATAPCGSPTRTALRCSASIRAPRMSSPCRSPACRPASPSRPTACGSRSAPDSVALIDPADQGGADPAGRQRPDGRGRGFGSIWVANHLDGTVSRLEPSTGTIEASIEVGLGPTALVPTTGSLWVANEYSDSVVSIDPGTNTKDQSVPVGGEAASLAGDDDGLWVAVGASSTEHRGGTLQVSSPKQAPTTLDPAIAYDTETWAILTNTNDGLLAYRKVGGPNGETLLPDLASALPDVSADGLTYRFPLRRGIHYSNGDPVRAEDFRRAIERSLVLNPAGYLLSTIEGADGCSPDEPSACDLSSSIVGDEEAVTFHLSRPDPELPLKLAMPFAFAVPADTPAEDQRLDPLPATGPYAVVAANQERLDMERNPSFQEWSAGAQPDGFVDAIAWRFGQGNLAGVFDQLQAGEVDVMLDTPTPQVSRDPALGASRSDRCLGRCIHALRGLRRPEAAVRRQGSPTGGQLRDRSPARGRHPRRADDPAPHLSDPAADPAGVRAILPLHRRRRGGRLVRPGPRTSACVDRRGRRDGHEDLGLRVRIPARRRQGDAVRR